MVFIQQFLVIETFAVLGVILSLTDRHRRAVFVVGFLVMLPSAALIALHGAGAPWRRWLIVALVALYVGRMCAVLLAWFATTGAAKLDTPSLAMRIALPLVLTNTAGWLYCAPFYWASERGGGFDAWDGAALGLYGLGTVIHVTADWQKHAFRRDSANRGKLLERGLWGLCRHPNYAGDTLVYVSFAVLSGSLFGLVAPAAVVLQYAFDAIPRNEAMNAARHGEVWHAYARRVKVFIPFIL
ncbi:DUF1295 domain-containing protein [Ancylobacter pratisalsi]|uniref:DUF1295 domain-containing protein n=1 Tax=Ancylobacter pratisalsi TaxID=1745854 RepID=A0A6P1YJU8_9HYPH|nr:DUF1295 domain-containing protein [Ancylobacter pratisalsi]QIB33657.1 DUF1295 domain-containing protein [Ancylobacter pratisalsi]